MEQKSISYRFRETTQKQKEESISSHLSIDQ